MKALNIWLDSEGDLLEVGWSVEKGYFTETDDERVLKRVNLDGEVIGFMVQGIGSMKGTFLDLDLGPEKPTDTVDNLTVKGAADELGVTEARVRQLASQGRIEARTRSAGTGSSLVRLRSAPAHGAPPERRRGVWGRHRSTRSTRPAVPGIRGRSRVAPRRGRRPGPGRR